MIYDILLKYGLTFIGVLFLFWLLGRIFLNIFAKPSQSVFLSLLAEVLTGVVLAVFGYSMFKTACNTINSGVLLLAVLYAFFNRSEIKLNTMQGFSAVFAPSSLMVSFGKISAIALPFFFYGAFYMLDASNPTGFALPHLDFVFYAKVSEYIAQTGYENFWQANTLLDSRFSDNLPYHYFELWLNAFVADAFGLLHLPSLHLVTYPIAQSLFCLGILAAFQAYKEKTGILEFLFSLLLTTFKGIYLTEFLSGIDYFWSNALNLPKAGFVYVFLMAAAAFFLHKSPKTSGFILLMLPIVYSPVAPAVFSGLTSVSAALWLLKKESRVLTGPILVSAVLSALYIGAFYFFNQSSEGIENPFVKPIPLDFAYIKTAVNIAGASALQIAYLFVFLAILFVLQLWKRGRACVFSKDIFIISFYALGVFASGLLTWAAMHKLADAPQLFQTIGIPVINVLGVACSVFVLAIPANKLLYYFLCVLLVFNAFNGFNASHKINGLGMRPLSDRFSNEYISSVKNYLEDTSRPSPIGASLFDSLDYIQGDSYYPLLHPFSVNLNVYVLGAQLKLIAPFFNTVCISPYSIPSQASIYRDKAIKSTPFYIYAEQMKKDGRFVSIGQCQLEFIDRNDIGYLIVSKNVVLPPMFEARIKHQIVDGLSGERFIFLNKSTAN